MVLAPFFEKAPSLIIAPNGSVLFECICNANPEPTIKWYIHYHAEFHMNVSHNNFFEQSLLHALLHGTVHYYTKKATNEFRFLKDKELTGDRYVSKIKKMVGKFTVTLHIKNPTQEDQGVYKVTATNPHGSHSVEQQYIYKCTGKEVFKTLD